MCFRSPTPPQLPDPEPMDSAVEQTAKKVVAGRKRRSTNNNLTGSTTTGRKRFGTQSLQIPLLPNSDKMVNRNLNYT